MFSFYTFLYILIFRNIAPVKECVFQEKEIRHDERDDGGFTPAVDIQLFAPAHFGKLAPTDL